MAEPSQASTVFVAQQPTAGVQTFNSGQQHWIVGQQPYSVSHINPRDRNKKTLRGLGIAEASLGGFSILLAIAANYIASFWSFFFNRTFTYTSQGIWCGVFMIIIGILGISVKKNPSKCMYVANMTMAIVVACISFTGFVLSGFAAGTSYFSTNLIIIHSIITIICLAVMIITIVHSAFCCSGVCYRSNSSST